MLRTFARLLRVLNSETHPAQIAGAVSLGAILGLTPLGSPHNLLVLLLALFLRINLSTFILAWALFSGVAYLADPAFHAVGLRLLTSDLLHGLWEGLYHTPLGRLSGFNNTVRLGSLVVAVVLAAVLFPVVSRLVVQYRHVVRDWVRRSRVMTFLKATKFYRIYAGLRG
jgi:uncharacterized protein (TIGR03546 family)